MSRQRSQRGLVALLALAGAGAAVAAVLSSGRLRDAVRGLWGEDDETDELREPVYMEIPDRPTGRDDVERGIAEGLAIAESMHQNGASSGVTVGVEEF